MPPKSSQEPTMREMMGVMLSLGGGGGGGANPSVYAQAQQEEQARYAAIVARDEAKRKIEAEAAIAANKGMEAGRARQREIARLAREEKKSNQNRIAAMQRFRGVIPSELLVNAPESFRELSPSPISSASPTSQGGSTGTGTSTSSSIGGIGVKEINRPPGYSTYGIEGKRQTMSGGDSRLNELTTGRKRRRPRKTVPLNTPKKPAPSLRAQEPFMGKEYASGPVVATMRSRLSESLPTWVTSQAVQPVFRTAFPLAAFVAPPPPGSAPPPRRPTVSSVPSQRAFELSGANTKITPLPPQPPPILRSSSARSSSSSGGGGGSRPALQLTQEQLRDLDAAQNRLTPDLAAQLSSPSSSSLPPSSPQFVPPRSSSLPQFGPSPPPRSLSSSSSVPPSRFGPPPPPPFPAHLFASASQPQSSAMPLTQRQLELLQSVPYVPQVQYPGVQPTMLRSVSAPSSSSSVFTPSNNGYDEFAEEYYFSMQPENFDEFPENFSQQNDWNDEEEEDEEYAPQAAFQDAFYFYPNGDDQMIYRYQE